jgi:N-dimethylarginine dimethylaminohydrolase
MMKASFHILIGVLLGLAGAAIVLARLEMRTTRPSGPPFSLLSDCDESIDELVIHYVVEAGDVVGPTYADFLTQLPDDVVVHVVCPRLSAFEDFQRRVGHVDCRLEPVVVGHEMTTWSRDRWLALQSEDGRAVRLVCPRSEKGQDAWPARRGDAQIASDLARTLGPHVTEYHSRLYFDGGDFVADNDTVFVTPEVLRRNLQQTVVDRRELIERLEALVNRQVVLLDVAPPHHAGMFMMAVGEQTVLVGDPLAAQRILRQAPASDPSNSLDADFSPETVAKFQAVADQCQRAGYRVVRIPVVPGRDGRTYLTYVNVMIDQRGRSRTVYMPVFDGVARLNEAAAEVWRQLGYQVKPVDCTRCSRHFGSLRCLVNVAKRDSRG